MTPKQHLFAREIVLGKSQADGPLLDKKGALVRELREMRNL